MNVFSKPPRSPAPNGLKLWLDQVDRAMQAGNMHEAARIAAQALALGHTHPALLTLRASAHRSIGRIDAALADLGRAIQMNPRSAWTLGEIADCHNLLGQFRKALEAANKALALDRKYSRVWLQKGFAHQGLVELAAARSAYLEAVALEPTLAEANTRLASIAAEQGRFDEARRFGAAALSASPGEPLVVIALATADLAEDRLADMERRLVEFLARRDVAPPHRAIALGLLGDLRDRQGKPADAFAAYSSARTVWADFHIPQWSSGEFGIAQALRLGAIPAPNGAGLHA